jgi:hypothetical protein
MTTVPYGPWSSVDGVATPTFFTDAQAHSWGMAPYTSTLPNSIMDTVNLPFTSLLFSDSLWADNTLSNGNIINSMHAYNSYYSSFDV